MFNILVYKKVRGCFGFDCIEKGNKSHREVSFKYTKTIEGNVIRGFFGIRTAFAVAA